MERYTCGVFCSLFWAMLAGCGGGGNENLPTPTPVITAPVVGQPVPTPTPIVSVPPTNPPVLLTVNKNGLFRTFPYSVSTSFVQNRTSGFYRPSDGVFGAGTPPIIEWSGTGLGYSSGYVFPTTGRVNSITIQSDELWYSVQNADFDSARATPSVNLLSFIEQLLSAAQVMIIQGGSFDDTLVALTGALEIDGKGGSDTVEFGQNFSSYRFQRIAGQPSSLIVSRTDGSFSTRVINVEFIKFADGTKSVSQILASLP